jgi:2-hydroxychromene-2-carboxylate isomerase
MTRPVLYYDVGSPFAYLAVARAEAVLGVDPLWQPVLLGGLFKLAGRSSWAVGDAARRAAGMRDIEERAARYGLPPIRWPDPWPGDYLTAMRAATWAQSIGAAQRFAVAATRRAFVDGRDLSLAAEVLEAVAAAGLDARAAEAAVGDPAVKFALRSATDAAHARGVFGVPTVAVGSDLFWGDDRLEDAATRAQHPATGPYSAKR